MESIESAMESLQDQGESISGLSREVVLAIAVCTLWPLLDERSRGTAAERSRALIFVPIVGLVLGVVLALVDYSLTAMLAIGARSFVVLLTGAAISLGLAERGAADLFASLRRHGRLASTGLARLGPLAILVALVVFVIKIWCLARIDSQSSRATAIVLAMMLSRWSMVPVAYGLKPLEQWGLGIPFTGGLSFREFSVSSAVALGLAMGLYRNVGLVVVIGVALVILAMRLMLSRGLGGVAGFSLAGGCALVEISAFAIVALLGA
jgi:adenosylcobinamide-GDP ribazoletransferase